MKGVSKRTKKLTASAVLSAMGVAIMLLGGLVETLDLSMAALASFLCVFAVIELGGAYPWAIFAVTSILSLVLMPYSMTGWFYLLFFGYYAIIKEKVEKLNSVISWVLKFIVFNAALALGVIVAMLMFLPAGATLLDTFIYVFGFEESGIWIAVGMYALINVVFLIYDIAVTKLITVYIYRLRGRFKFLK